MSTSQQTFVSNNASPITEFSAHMCDPELWPLLAENGFYSRKKDYYFVQIWSL